MTRQEERLILQALIFLISASADMVDGIQADMLIEALRKELRKD